MKLRIIDTPLKFKIEVVNTTTGRMIFECGYHGGHFKNEIGDEYEVLTGYHSDQYRNIEIKKLELCFFEREVITA